MKENLSKKSWNFGPTQNFAKCPKLAREAPRAIQKIKKKMGPKGPGPNFGPRVPVYSPLKVAILFLPTVFPLFGVYDAVICPYCRSGGKHCSSDPTSTHAGGQDDGS